MSVLSNNNNNKQFFFSYFIFVFSFLLLLILFSSPVYSISFNVCNVEINEPWFIVSENVTNKDILIVDSEGDIYFEGIDHTRALNVDDKTFYISDYMYFNKFTSKFTLTNFLQNLSSVPTANSLVIQNKSGFNVTSFTDYNIYTIGKGVYNGSQAGCPSDGNYCNGNLVEIRNNFCDLVGSKSGVCSFTVTGSENCAVKLSEDTDGGINYNVAGIVTDYTSCSGGSCSGASYTDSCLGNTLTEYIALGVSYSNSTKNCALDNTPYCSGTNVWTTNYLCGSGLCYMGSDSLLQSCVATATSYGSWSCSDINTKVRSVTTYSPTCSGGACGASIANPSTNEYVPCVGGTYCSGGSCNSITYSWQTSGFGACSQSCGGGTQTQTVTCKRDYDSAVVADINCNLALKPATSQSCNLGSCCGNNLINSGETCDSGNLNGNSCTTLGMGFTGGTLSCNPTCSAFITSSCTSGSTCTTGTQVGITEGLIENSLGINAKITGPRQFQEIRGGVTKTMTIPSSVSGGNWNLLSFEGSGLDIGSVDDPIWGCASSFAAVKCNTGTSECRIIPMIGEKLCGNYADFSLSATGLIFYDIQSGGVNYLSSEPPTSSISGGLIAQGSNYVSAAIWTNNNVWGYCEVSPFISATGGTITYDGDYKIHTFTTVGSSTFNVISGSGNVDVLVVAGGGGGGSAQGDFSDSMGSGGGGGGVSEHIGRTISSGEYVVIVGDGGSGGRGGFGEDGINGGDSSFDNIISYGGGGGAGSNSVNGKNGGSAGGPYWAYGGVGISNQINTGGATGYGYRGGEMGDTYNGVGGGGAGGLGSSVYIYNANGGAGGLGRANNISGIIQYYGGGGGGGGGFFPANLGGIGGSFVGGNGGARYLGGSNGVINSGGGGGGVGHTSTQSGGSGGSGIVIVRYKYK